MSEAIINRLRQIYEAAAKSKLVGVPGEDYCINFEGELRAVSAAFVEAERRGEERAWAAARNPNLVTVTIIDGYEWITPTTIEDWRASEEYKEGK